MHLPREHSLLASCMGEREQVLLSIEPWHASHGLPQELTNGLLALSLLFYTHKGLIFGEEKQSFSYHFSKWKERSMSIHCFSRNSSSGRSLAVDRIPHKTQLRCARWFHKYTCNFWELELCGSCALSLRNCGTITNREMSFWFKFFTLWTSHVHRSCTLPFICL